MSLLRQIGRAIIIGPPGAGKGTIASRIVRDFDIVHLSNGDLLRKQMNTTVAGREARKHVERGHLVPDQIMIDMVLAELIAKKGKSWLLDGFPRTVDQASALSLAEPIDIVLNLDIAADSIVERQKGRLIHEPSGRTYHTEFSPPKVPGKDDKTGEDLIQPEDDTPAQVLARIDQYKYKMTPVLNYYRKQGKVVNIKGRYTNEVWPMVHEKLSEYIKCKQFTTYD